MRKSLLMAGAVLGIMLLADPSSAQRNEPKKAGKFKSSLVTAYNECPSGTGLDDSTGTIMLPACQGAVPSDDTCTIGPKGSGQMAAKADAAGDVAFKVKLKDIQNCNGQNLVAVVSVRVTTNGCVSGDINGCTVEDLNDFPISAGSSCTIADGKCQMSSTVNTELGAGVINAGDLAAFELRGCGLKRPAGPGTPGKVAACGLLIP